MQLITNPASPFCRKVEIVLLETGLNTEVEYCGAKANPLDTPAMIAEANPIGKIPALIPENGRAIYDSRVICRYLDDRAKAGLYPAEGLWDALTLEATGDAICDSGVAMVYEGRFRPPERQHAPWVEGQWSKIERSLDALSGRFMPLLEGPLNIGQIAVACGLGYLDFRHADRDWRAGRDDLAAWYATFLERPALAATIPHD